MDARALGSGFDNRSVEGWDSVRQLSLATAVEESFGIMLDPEDILDLTSYDNARTILAKYDIEL